MGSGKSGLSGGSRGGGKAVKSVAGIDLSESPLIYGNNDGALSGNARDFIEQWEDKRVKGKLEYNVSVDQDGNLLHDEVRGGKKSVRVPAVGLSDGAIHTHIHPREEAGVLGGTFSDADLYNFANHGVATYRARAKEGAYSISKQKGFNRDGFKAYVKNLFATEHATMKQEMSDITKKFRDKSFTYEQYSAEFDKAFNKFLISTHNGLLKGQKQYGYFYTLEGGKK